jgi:alanine dehydrogenase
MPTPIYIKESDVAEFLDMPAAIQALRDIFAAEAKGQANTVPRTRWPFGSVRLNVMGGGERAGKRFAVKSYGGGAFHVMLYEEGKGLLAVIEANTLGQIRTGAASAVATEKMARPNAGKVALIGTGRQARTQALALKAIGALTELAVFSRNREKLVTFCYGLAEELGGVPVVAAESGEHAVAGADIVVTATNSAEPVLMDAWLTPGAHINAMGANAANRRELEPATAQRAALIVTDHIAQAKTEAAEFIDLDKAGKFDWSKVKTLAELVAGPRPARDANAITLFKSLGVGLEDVAVASVIYDRATTSGRFKPV